MTSTSARPSTKAGWWADRPVGTRIMTTALSGAIAAAAVGGVALAQLGELRDATAAVYQDHLLPMNALGMVHQEELKTRAMVASAAAATASGPKAVTTYLEKVQGSDDDLDASAAKYVASMSGVAADDYAAFTKAWDDYRAVRDSRLVPAIKAGDLATYDTLQTEVAQPLISSAADLLDVVEAKETAAAEAKYAKAVDGYERGRTLAIAMVLAAFLLAAGLGRFVTRSVTRPLKAVSEVLKALATGDLTRRADIGSTDELGVMAGDLDVAMASMREALQTLGRTAQTLGGSSDELTVTSTTIAASAEQASAQANVVSAAAEQVSRNVQSVATGAEEMGASHPGDRAERQRGRQGRR